jgi:hypothetical protein
LDYPNTPIFTFHLLRFFFNEEVIKNLFREFLAYYLGCKYV